MKDIQAGFEAVLSLQKDFNQIEYVEKLQLALVQVYICILHAFNDK